MFDPSKHAPDPNEKDRKFVTKPGEYVGAFTRIGQSGSTEGGKDFVRFTWTVIAGPSAGQIISERIFITANAYKRLGAFCAAMGVTKAFEPSDRAAIMEAFVGRPFKSVVKIRGEYSELDYKPLRDLTEAERDGMRAWELKHHAELLDRNREVLKREGEKQSGSGATDFPDDSWPNDDDAPPETGRAKPTAVPDDDVPF